ncbi:hypothetical protein OBBRIDRAFT_732020, partial [Obba rivulosa]
GDFNIHHPMWNEERNHHLFTAVQLNHAQPLLDLITALELHMLLPHGLLSSKAFNTKNLTRPDNVFSTEGFLECLISCSTLPNHQLSRANHFPIATTFNLELPAVKDTLDATSA